MGQLQELALRDFTGGLNLRSNQFNLALNESPSMTYIDIDPRGGFKTRLGWIRWNQNELVDDPANWNPRNSFTHPLSNGSYQIYIANNNTIHASGPDGIFSDLQIACGGNNDPDLADFDDWGDSVYIACSPANQSVRRDGFDAPVLLGDASLGYNDDYTVPVKGRFPQCDHVAAHSGYMFAANIKETDGTTRDNRLRWSHPNNPEDWANDDYLDIEVGGGRITGIISFRDHLLIFKTDSMWALYGYDLQSWQLIQVSRAIGVPSAPSISRSDTAVYFYSASGRNGVYGYDGQQPVLLSESLDPAMEAVAAPEDIWVTWIGRRLWVTVPWTEKLGADSSSSTTFVFDPTLQNGAWVAYKAAVGSFQFGIEGSDIQTNWPLGVIRDAGTTWVGRLDISDRAEDVIGADLAPTPFKASYTTPWMYAGQPERRKSWRRPRFITGKVFQETTVDLSVYWDYDESDIRRYYRGTGVPAESASVWSSNGLSPGFEWSELGGGSVNGADWGLAAKGSDIRRGTSGLGVSRSLQMTFSTSPNDLPEFNGSPWSFDAVVLKYLWRRFTT